jgi:hypothetical protein
VLSPTPFPSTKYYLISDNRRLENNLKKLETHGRKSFLSAAQVKEADCFLQDVGWDARVLTWEQLSTESDFGVSGWTLKRALGSMNYYKCIACTKG